MNLCCPLCASECKPVKGLYVRHAQGHAVPVWSCPRCGIKGVA